MKTKSFPVPIPLPPFLCQIRFGEWGSNSGWLPCLLRAVVAVGGRTSSRDAHVSTSANCGPRLRPFASLLLLSLVLLLAGGRVHAAPAKPNLEAAVITAGTSIVGTDGRNWAYVVWQSPGAATLQGKAFAVYLQTAPAGTFTRQAIVSPTADVPALALLAARAATLRADNAELDRNLRDLLRRKSWAGSTNTNGLAANLSTFDSKPLPVKMSAVLGRALQSADALSAVQLLAPQHPALRMALGRAWAGILPPGAGPMVLEIREWVSGAAGGVLGRVTLVPGQAITLVSPGRIVQVPDLKPSGDLTIKLRWAAPDALRRLQQHVLGFRVYRVRLEDAGGLALNASAAQLTAWINSHPTVVQPVNDAPVPIAKLFADAAVDNFSFDTGDRRTFFVADDAHRLAPLTEAANSPRAPGFNAGQRCRYWVAAVDLLGRVGPPSPPCEGIAERTIPPDVPGNLTVTERPVGPNGERQLVLRWKTNALPAGVANRTTSRYAIYRGPVPDGMPASLATLEDPAQFKTLAPIAFITEGLAGADGHLRFTDNGLAPTAGNTDRSVWYAITALHDTQLDWFAAAPGVPANPHELVQSAPSPPAFGIFRDRTGPAAPTGGVYVNCDKLVTQAVLPVTTAPRVSAVADASRAHIRALCTRRNRSVVAARFTFSDLRDPPPAGLIWDTQWIAFPADGDELTYEISLLNAQSDWVAVTCVTLDAHGCQSTLGYADRQRPALNAALWHEFRFVTGRFAATAFASDSTAPVANLATVVPFTSTTTIGPGVKRGVFAAAENLNGQTVVLQLRLLTATNWSTFATAQVVNHAVVFPFIVPEGLFQYRAAKLPVGGDCQCAHDARPVDALEIQPVTVFLNLPATTKEWRIFRAADGGPLALVKSGVVDLTQGAVDSVIAQDKAMPPNGARLRYFGQCFDQNHNPSPLKFLAEVQLLPAPATPVLNPPEFIVAGGQDQVKLKWFCPTPGVQRFRVMLLALGAGATANKAAPLLPAGTTNVSYGSINGGALLNLAYTLAGESEKKYAAVFYAFDLPPLTGAGLPLHEAVFQIARDQTYLAFVSAISFGELIVTDSKAQQFSWKTPPAPAVGEPLVPWPARPLPPVVANPLGSAFLMTDVTFPTSTTTAPGFNLFRSAISSWSAANLYPVGIRIGVLPSVPENNRRAEDVTGLDPPITYDRVTGPLASPPPNLVTDPTTHVFPGLLPSVLFRQTLLPDGRAGALVQVTPLREGIAWKREVTTSLPTGLITYVSLLRDPFIKALTYDAGGTSLCWLNLVDTHSVAAGATYHYYLASYGRDGEINLVWDCGTVTIPAD